MLLIFCPYLVFVSSVCDARVLWRHLEITPAIFQLLTISIFSGSERMNWQRIELGIHE